jgi:hypothetical protein
VLKIQSHRTVVRGNKRRVLKCEECRKYKKKRRIVPFCVLEPMLSKAAYSLKIPKTRDLPLLANKMQERQ